MPLDTKTNITCHSSVEARDDQKLDIDRRSEAQLPNKFAWYRWQLLKFHSEFQLTWDDHLRKVSIAIFSTALVEHIAQSIYAASYCEEQSHSKLVVAEIVKMNFWKATKAAQAKLAVWKVFVSKTKVSLSLFIDDKKLIAVIKRDTYSTK